MSTILKTTKYTVISFIGYIASTSIIIGIVMSIWLSQQDTAQLSAQQLSLLAEESITIQFISAVLGLLATFIIGYVLCKKTIQNEVTTIKAFTVTITLFSILSIVLHPEHHVIYQVAKLITPIAACFASFKMASKHLAK